MEERPRDSSCPGAQSFCSQRGFSRGRREREFYFLFCFHVLTLFFTISITLRNPPQAKPHISIAATAVFKRYQLILPYFYSGVPF